MLIPRCHLCNDPNCLFDVEKAHRYICWGADKPLTEDAKEVLFGKENRYISDEEAQKLWEMK